MNVLSLRREPALCPVQGQGKTEWFMETLFPSALLENRKDLHQSKKDEN